MGLAGVGALSSCRPERTFLMNDCHFLTLFRLMTVFLSKFLPSKRLLCGQETLRKIDGEPERVLCPAESSEESRLVQVAKAKAAKHT